MPCRRGIYTKLGAATARLLIIFILDFGEGIV
jgi:hypothetical protein